MKSYTLMQEKHLLEDLEDRKVIRGNNTDEEPRQGRIVAVNNSGHIGRVWVLWSGELDPASHRPNELMLLDKNDAFRKKLSWHGKRFGELDAFVQQAKREGVLPDAKLNDNEPGTHVHVNVPLPLVPTEPGKHDHDFTEKCMPLCPAFRLDPGDS